MSNLHTPDFYIKVGNTAPVYEAILLEPNGEPSDLTNATAVQLHLRRWGSLVALIHTGDIDENPDSGRVSYAWQAGDTDVPGSYWAEWKVTYADGTERSWPNFGHDHVLISGDVDLLEESEEA